MEYYIDDAFNDEPNPVYISVEPSTTTRYFSFIAAQTNTVLWTPAQGNRIYMTGVSITATGLTRAQPFICAAHPFFNDQIFFICHITKQHQFVDARILQKYLSDSHECIWHHYSSGSASTS